MRPATIRGGGGVGLAADVGGDPSGRPVVLLHGGGQTRHSWRNTQQTLVGQGYRVVNYDARGHGDSQWAQDGDYSLDALKADLMAVIDTLDGPPVLIGASMGGSTALITIGETERSIAAALVLVDIVPKANAAGVQRVQDFMSANTDGFESLDDACEAAAAYNPHRKRPATPDGLRKNLRLRADGRYYWHWDPAFLTSRKRPTAETIHERAALASAGVRVPGMLVSGLSSDVVTEDGIDDLKARIPHLKVAAVKDAGHMVAGDANDVFNASLFEFLDGLNG